MVASAGADVASLADVLPSCLAAAGNSAFSNVLGVPDAKTVVLFLIDGLGRENLRGAGAHARFLNAQPDHRILETVFPSTTASALASLVTGAHPGQHGVTGYRVWHPGRAEVVNQLNGLTVQDVRGGWLAQPSLIAPASGGDVLVTVIGHPRFSDSTLTKLLYGDAPYRGAVTVEEKFTQLARLLNAGTEGVILVYISDLDECAHRLGVQSLQWHALLEDLDAAFATFARSKPSDVVAVVTADHGVIDVPSEKHMNFGLGPEMHGVSDVGGEPRCLQVYLDGSVDNADVAAAWAELAGELELVVSGQHAAAAWWGGVIGADVAPRIPDLFVFAPEGGAWYDGREPLAPARNMIGQHGGISATERAIPLIVLS